MDRKFKLDDSFKKALEEAVVSYIPAISWMDEYREAYDKLLKSGMFFEFHPTWIGDWDKDKYAFCHNRGWEKADPQDIPAVCEYSGLPAVEYYSSREITIEDIRKITKLMDDLNVIDTRDDS